jgi:2-phospho-L-lactate/phosphoenolpyruvate guanylyltransferase
MMRTAAVIPIKQLENAKQRLASMLSTDERNQLFRKMVEDVLTATQACALVDEIIVVTDDDVAARLASRYGASVLSEPEQAGLIASVTKASRYLADEGVDIMLFLPGDVPLVTAEELRIVLEGFGMQAGAEFLIVPASDLGGSNCIACSPPDCMEFGFGEDSFRRHLAIARRLGIEPAVAKLPGIGLDVDTPDDLIELASILVTSRIESHTHRYFRKSGIMGRISEDLLKMG